MILLPYLASLSLLLIARQHTARMTIFKLSEATLHHMDL